MKGYKPSTAVSNKYVLVDPLIKIPNVAATRKCEDIGLDFIYVFLEKKFCFVWTLWQLAQNYFSFQSFNLHANIHVVTINTDLTIKLWEICKTI